VGAGSPDASQTPSAADEHLTTSTPFSLDAYADQALVLLGLPTDANSSFARGAARAPAALRAALACDSAHLTAENGVDLSAPGQLFDAGDVDLGPAGEQLDAIRVSAETILERGARLLSIGGDHAVTHPLLQAHQRLHSSLTILHFDAHPDLYDDFEGNPRSHASPFARIMEAGLARRLVQVGIRALNAHLRQQVERFDVEVIEMREWSRVAGLQFDGPLYLSFDLDVLDPSCAPGVSHWEPGGATTRQVLDLIHSIDVPIVGADVVELNPERDAAGMSAMVAARVLREIAGKMLE
jgi:arginase